MHEESWHNTPRVCMTYSRGKKSVPRQSPIRAISRSDSLTSCIPSIHSIILLPLKPNHSFVTIRSCHRFPCFPSVAHTCHLACLQYLVTCCSGSPIDFSHYEPRRIDCRTSVLVEPHRYERLRFIGQSPSTILLFELPATVHSARPARQLLQATVTGAVSWLSTE